MGAGLILTPEPTGLTKIGGVALIGHGADTTAAGLKQLWMGQSVQTFTSQIISGGLITAGVPSPYANLVGGLTEIGMAAVPIGIVGKVGTIGQSAQTLSNTAAASSLQGTLLHRYLHQVQKYGSQGVKEWESGRFRFYGNIVPPRVPGEMAGFQLVREWDPVSNTTRTWFQTLDGAGIVRQIRPVVDGPKAHYQFDAKGNYIGNW